MKNCKSGSFQLNFLLPVLAFFEGGSQSSWSWWDVILGRPLSSHITLVSHPPWWTNTNITLKLLDHVSLTVSPRLFTRNYQMMTKGHHGMGQDLLWVWCSHCSEDHNSILPGTILIMGCFGRMRVLSVCYRCFCKFSTFSSGWSITTVVNGPELQAFI